MDQNEIRNDKNAKNRCFQLRPSGFQLRPDFPPLESAGPCLAILILDPDQRWGVLY